ncbi:hypothetical protein SAMN02927921_01189 [Sinomicrobium oceani]|uniref:Uncharacterized protein n=1 Tax=Sinomicrobium oceani TaxID=1150368 RepID=A0A1K1NDM8_9FLAO|nr:hypothetical protein [Sinomicrobium oceani]SFW33554.1 hypothetical protein SAMN02927921_01189 [Sinomicrobium oceani]
MKSLGDKIALDQQFTVELPKNKNSVVSTFLRNSNPLYRVTRPDENTLIIMSETEENWWSPQLYLEVNKVDESRTLLFGWFAPRSLLWNTLLSLQLFVGLACLITGTWIIVAWSASSTEGIAFLWWIFPITLAIWGMLYAIRSAKKARGKTFIYGFYEFLNNRSILN